MHALLSGKIFGCQILTWVWLGQQNFFLACIFGVESIVESWVSTTEAHCTAVRGILNQQRMEDEICVAINGPHDVHADNIIKEAMEKMWKEKQYYFVRRSTHGINAWTVSKAVDNLSKKEVKLPVMM